MTTGAQHDNQQKRLSPLGARQDKASDNLHNHDNLPRTHMQARTRTRAHARYGCAWTSCCQNSVRTKPHGMTTFNSSLSRLSRHFTAAGPSLVATLCGWQAGGISQQSAIVSGFRFGITHPLAIGVETFPVSRETLSAANPLHKGEWP